LYTYGAPKTAIGQLENPLAGDQCFSGMRIVNKDKSLIYRVDIVPTLLATTRYAHVRHDPMFLYQDGTSEKKDCGWVGTTVERARIGLHDTGLYVERSANVRALRDVGRVALAISYESDVEKAAAFVRKQGFGMVASAVDKRYDEVSHLIQDPSTLDCWLTFEGSDNVGDWINNLNVVPTRFCGLAQRVHSGFRHSVMHIVEVPEFQKLIRPNLGHCRNVDVVGHSLGGSIASLFAACTHSNVRSGETGYNEHQHFHFEKLQTKRFDYV